MNVQQETIDYKVLIYPADRSFTPSELKQISERICNFLHVWKSHGDDLSSSFGIEYQRFIIIRIDENKKKASGCSISALDRVMKEIDADYNLGLFDRMKACYMEDDKEIKTLKLSEFRSKIKQGKIPASVKVFDFSKSTYFDFLKSFLLPLKESWAGSIC